MKKIVVCLFLSLLLGVFAFATLSVAQIYNIYDQEVYYYPTSLTYITSTGFYSDDARIYTGTSALYAQLELSDVYPSYQYIIYAWVFSDTSYGAMRYSVDGQYLNTLNFPSLTNDWNLVGDITTEQAADIDPPILTIDRAYTGSGTLVVDGIKLVGYPISSTTEQEPAPLDNWYLAGQVPASCVLGAYQAMGADSLASSYTNLNDPGVNDLTVGSAPGWNTADGWVFDGSNYLITSFSISKSMSIISRVKYGVDDDDSQFVSHLFDDPLSIGMGLVDSLFLFSKGNYEHSYSATLGIEHVTAVAYLDDGISYPFLDGIKQDSLGSDDISSPYSPIIGAQNDSGSILDYMVGTVQAFAFYDCPLTEIQVRAVSDAMIGAVGETDVVYTLPTTGDPVLYHREISFGDLATGAPVWALVILLFFREIWKVATRGQ